MLVMTLGQWIRRRFRPPSALALSVSSPCISMVSRLTLEMHRDDTDSARGGGGRKRRSVHCPSVITNIDESNHSSSLRDGFGGRDERIRHRHHFVAWL